MKNAIAFITCLFYACLCTAQTDDAGSYYTLYQKQGAAKLKTYWTEEAAQYHLQNAIRVLDVGGSDGKLIVPIAMVADTVDYYLEDINANNFSYAGRFFEFAKKEINPKAHFALHTIVGGDSSINYLLIFDRIIVRETLHHFSYKTQMLREFKRLLAPDGMVVISEPASKKNFKHCDLIPSDKLISLFTNKGFKLSHLTKTKTDFLIYTFTR